MSWQMEDEDAIQQNVEPEEPEEWQQTVDDEQWKNETQQQMDREHDIDSEDQRTDASGAGKASKAKRARSISHHYNLESTEPLSPRNGAWILIKSIMLWIYLILLSTGLLNLQTHSPQTIWAIAYFILLICWCIFFRSTASSSRGGFYPFIGDWTQQIYHSALFIAGLAGVDMYFLERKRVIMRECVMQYKVLEFSVLWFSYFISFSWSQYPWSAVIDERYKNWGSHFSQRDSWWEFVNTIPVLWLLMDSIIHYSKVYHAVFWEHSSTSTFTMNLRYAAVLLVFYLDAIIRGLLLLLFVDISPFLILVILLFYVIFTVTIWAIALGKSMDAPAKHIKIAMKKSGGKLIQAMFLSFWSVGGLFEILPTIASSSDNIQQQQRIQQKWGQNVVRLDCFIRLLLSVVLFTRFWVMEDAPFSKEEKSMVYLISICFALYPYAMETVLQSPLSLLCRGSFFLVHHVDTLTSLPNEFRFHKDVTFKMQWKNGMIVTNVRGLDALNTKYGRKCGDETVIKIMQRIIFEVEEQASVKMKMYRVRGDRFLIVSAFSTEEEFKEFIESLCRIEITVLRPSDFDANDRRNEIEAAKSKKDDDVLGAEQENTDKMDNDDFINPNNMAAGGYNDNDDGGGNWYDDDDEEDKGQGDDGNDEGDGNKKVRLKRTESIYNKHTAHESMVIGLRVAGSFGPFCSLPHAMSMDKELQEMDKDGKIYSERDKYMIHELKEHL